MQRPEVQYAQSGDLSIAYQVIGDGPFDLVFVPGFVSHQDLAWDIPTFAQMLTRFGSFARAIVFDKRGTGLSDRSLGFGTAEDRMDDIRAVMDAAGSERAALVGVSEGGPLTILFAATYPERTAALVLWATFARVVVDDDYPVGIPPELPEKLAANVSRRWGRGTALRYFLSNMPDDPETVKLIARYERSAITPTKVREILQATNSMDVRAALPAVSAPALVMSRTGDLLTPPPFGRYLAEHIAGARYVELPGDWHLNGGPAGEADALDVVEEFLTGRRHEAPVEVDRVLKTILFTDIVGSTERAAELGDRRWRDLLDAHDRAVRHELERHRGVEVKTTGDGFLAAFDGPGRAVHCAQATVGAARDLGLEMRAGLHSGECEVRGDDLAGLTVHIGSRVAALAGPGEVLVTSTVRDLVIGSDLSFSDRGVQELKGVPGQWHVLAVT
jgi:class 3 adenylate cyclase/alpha-beta hydrolase superfamily lysophospholipase